MKKMDLLLKVLLIVGLVLVTMIIVKKVKKSPEKSRQEETLNTSGERKKDYGFKFKINDCLSYNGKDLMVVDFDGESEYVMADVKRFYQGPHPILDGDLIKESAKSLDSKNAEKVSCKELEEKFMQ